VLMRAAAPSAIRLAATTAGAQTRVKKPRY